MLREGLSSPKSGPIAGTGLRLRFASSQNGSMSCRVPDHPGKERYLPRHNKHNTTRTGRGR